MAQVCPRQQQRVGLKHWWLRHRGTSADTSVQVAAYPSRGAGPALQPFSPTGIETASNPYLYCAGSYEWHIVSAQLGSAEMPGWIGES